MGEGDGRGCGARKQPPLDLSSAACWRVDSLEDGCRRGSIAPADLVALRGPRLAQEQKSKEAKALAAANSSKGKRKKWSKGKQK